MIYIAQSYPVPVEIAAINAARCGDLQPLEYSEMDRWEVFAFDATAAVHFKCRFADHILAQDTLPNGGVEFVIDDNTIGDELREWLENSSDDIIAMECTLVEFTSKEACERFENEFVGLLGWLLAPGANLKMQCKTIINYAQGILPSHLRPQPQGLCTRGVALCFTLLADARRALQALLQFSRRFRLS